LSGARRILCAGGAAIDLRRAFLRRMVPESARRAIRIAAVVTGVAFSLG
jgi:hypothetical protein